MHWSRTFIIITYYILYTSLCIGRETDNRQRYVRVLLLHNLLNHAWHVVIVCHNSKASWNSLSCSKISLGESRISFIYAWRPYHISACHCGIGLTTQMCFHLLDIVNNLVLLYIPTWDGLICSTAYTKPKLGLPLMLACIHACAYMYHRKKFQEYNCRKAMKYFTFTSSCSTVEMNSFLFYNQFTSVLCDITAPCAEFVCFQCKKLNTTCNSGLLQVM